MNSRLAATAGDANSASSTGIYPCDEGHGNTEACPKCIYREYRRKQVFRKKLSRSDVQRKGSYRLYLPKPCAVKFRPPANGSEVVIFHDVQMKRWPMLFRTSCGNDYLAGGWSQFAREKQLGEGDTVTFYEVRCGQRTRLFMIGVSYKDRLQILGAPIN